MDLDVVLTEIGELGKFQIGVYILLFFPLIFSAMGSLAYIFTAGDIDYRCKVPECEINHTSFEKPWLPFALPYSGGKIENHCKRYKSIDDSYHQNCSATIFFLNQTEKCHQFVFKNSENTVVKEFNLLCDENNWKRSIVGTLHSIGEFLGMFLGGILSDRFGRQMMITTAVLCSSIIGILKSSSFNYIQFVLLEVLDAIALGGIYPGIFILAVEMTGPNKRTLVATIISSYFSVGEIILGLIVLFVKDWRNILRIIYIPGFIMVSYYWILPESIRWLSLNGKEDKVLKMLERISYLNKKPISDNLERKIEQISIQSIEIRRQTSETIEIVLDIKKSETSDNQNTGNPVKELFKSRIIMIRILICSFCWITNAFVYYGLSLRSVVIGGDKYFNFILVSLIEIPGYIITRIVVDIFGRRSSISVSLIISGLACTMFHFLDSDMEKLRLISFLLGKCAITVSFTAFYISVSEFFPTNLRHVLMGFCSTIGRFGSMLAPLTPLLSAFVDPVLIFGAAACLAGIVALSFPETLHCKLPDTIAEAEVVGRKKKSTKM